MEKEIAILKPNGETFSFNNFNNVKELLKQEGLLITGEEVGIGANYLTINSNKNPDEIEQIVNKVIQSIFEGINNKNIQTTIKFIRLPNNHKTYIRKKLKSIGIIITKITKGKTVKGVTEFNFFAKNPPQNWEKEVLIAAKESKKY